MIRGAGVSGPASFDILPENCAPSESVMKPRASRSAEQVEEEPVVVQPVWTGIEATGIDTVEATVPTAGQ